MRMRFLVAMILTSCAPTLTQVAPGPEFELAPGPTVQLAGTPRRAGVPPAPAEYRARIRWSTP